MNIESNRTKATASQTPATTGMKHPGENFTEGSFWLLPEEEIDIHPASLKFRRLNGHWEALQRSLRAHGQLADARTAVIGGKRTLIDGNSRRKLLAEDGKPLRCRDLGAAELGDKTVDEWILENNLNGSTARQLTDTQRALQSAEFESEFRAAAAKRSESGKRAAEGQIVGRTEEHLAKIANCKASRVRQAILLKKKADDALLDAVWQAKISLSIALKIVELPDPDDRAAALAAAKAGDKRGFKRAIGKRLVDGLRQTVPYGLQSVFEEATCFDKAKAHIDAAIDLLYKVSAPGIDLTQLRGVFNSLQDFRPFCVCPFCDGTGRECRICEGTRWLTVRRYETAKSQERDKRRRG